MQNLLLILKMEPFEFSVNIIYESYETISTVFTNNEDIDLIICEDL